MKAKIIEKNKGDYIMEEWKVIDFATNYEVSNLGHIRNRTTKKVLKGRDTKSGYL